MEEVYLQYLQLHSILRRELGVSKTKKDISAASNLKRKDLARTYRHLVVELDYKVPNTDPVKCIAKVANKTNLTEKTKHQAFNIMQKVTENEYLLVKTQWD